MGAALMLLRALPFRDWLELAGVAIVAGLVAWGVHHEREVGDRAGAARVQAQWNKQRAVDQAAADQARTINQAESDRRLAEKDRIANEAHDQADAARADAALALRARDSMRAALAVFVASSRARAEDPGSLAGSATAGGDLDLLADVLERVDERAGSLAAIADQARIAGLACERSFDSLRVGGP